VDEFITFMGRLGKGSFERLCDLGDRLYYWLERASVGSEEQSGVRTELFIESNRVDGGLSSEASGVLEPAAEVNRGGESLCSSSRFGSVLARRNRLLTADAS
jgi:hypothetical protein